MKKYRNLFLNARHQQQPRHPEAKKLKGCQLKTINRNMELRIGFLDNQTKPNTSVKDTN